MDNGKEQKDLTDKTWEKTVKCLDYKYCNGTHSS